MYIAYICPRYYPYVGGIEYVVKSMAERLVKRGHNIIVITGESSISKPVKEHINGVKVIRIPTFAPGNAYYIPKKYKTLYTALMRHFDIVHTHSAHAIISIMPLIIKQKRRPQWKLVMTLHFSTLGYTTTRRIIWKVYWKKFLSKKLMYADLIHATSIIERKYIKKYFPHITKEPIIIPVGLEEDVLSYTWKGKNSDYLLYSGRIEKYKNIDLAIKAVRLIIDQGYDIKLAIHGSGSYYNQLKKLVKKLRLNKYVSIKSPMPRVKYLDSLSKARAAISLSSAENFNIFLAEAYTIGVPIIATQEAVAFCPQIANVIFNTPRHIAEVILNTILRDTMSFKPPNIPCKIRLWNNIIISIEKLYKEILSK